MGKRDTPHPDHYQTAPRAGAGPDVYREEVEKLRAAEEPPIQPGKPKRGAVIHAGEPLETTIATICVQCELEVALAGGAPVLPCQNCGSDSFRVV